MWGRRYQSPAGFSVRHQGKMVFFDFRDRSGFVQGVVLPNSAAIETAKEIRSEYGAGNDTILGGSGNN